LLGSQVTESRINPRLAEPQAPRGGQSSVPRRGNTHRDRTPAMTSTVSLRLALVEPDQPGNFGALLRLAACFAIDLEVVEPLGFPLDERRVRRVGMDYAQHVLVRRHVDLARFFATMAAEGRRLVLLSAKAETAYHRFAFECHDVIVVGSESRGAPPDLVEHVAARLRIPIRPGMRSLNVVTAAAIGLAEALRQLDALPDAAASGQNRSG
jgi:tRNA (cytidine/uridine-2'-O-)-methyltransferase